MKKIIVVTSLLVIWGLTTNAQNPFCDSVAAANVATDREYGLLAESLDQQQGFATFKLFDNVQGEYESKSISCLTFNGKEVTFIDVLGKFPELTKNYDQHFWRRAEVGCPTLVRSRNGVVIRVRYDW